MAFLDPAPVDPEKSPQRRNQELQVPSEGSHRHLTTHESASAYSRGDESQRHSEAVAITIDYNHNNNNQSPLTPHSGHKPYEPESQLYQRRPHSQYQQQQQQHYGYQQHQHGDNGDDDDDDDAYSDSTTHTHPINGVWIHPKNLWIILRHRIYPFFVKIFTHGTSVDVHALQRHEWEGKKAKRMAKMHARAKQYDNKVEHLYSFIQVMTACTASFAHGSNDVANAIGPYSAIYAVWSSGKLVDHETPVPLWILAFGGAWIVIGE
jgi:phosphate/sulfate permease